MAKSITKPPGGGKGTPAPQQHEQSAGHGGGNPIDEATSALSYGWERDEVPAGLLAAGKGMVPRVEGEDAKAPDTGGRRKAGVREIVRQAVSRLRLPKPVIHTSPREDLAQVVRVPTWIWVDKGTWGSVATSAAVDGVSVTAKARPRKAVWSMGDGAVVECRGPGTPYSDRFDPKESSPDCGYTYQQASTSMPGKAFPVKVQVVWDVEWEGGGKSGVVPGLVMAAERPLVVDEVQAVVTH
ncbi:hypothetical protein [Streptomyces sp. MspMP-M5]|uniref:hypothetical protein n=1 Tax=unclassified Streptomyces TaxID=2593676 RepID=UPI001F472057|nr:hypothetical protein [Streptomyces sp. MspMP-M5]